MPIGWTPPRAISSSELPWAESCLTIRRSCATQLQEDTYYLQQRISRSLCEEVIGGLPVRLRERDNTGTGNQLSAHADIEHVSLRGVLGRFQVRGFLETPKHLDLVPRAHQPPSVARSSFWRIVTGGYKRSAEQMALGRSPVDAIA